MPRARIGRIDIEYQITGRGEPLVLLMGSGTPHVFWEDSFCADLAAAGLQVVRFDWRDVGRSSAIDVPVPASIPEALSGLATGAIRAPYSLDELATDVVGLLDHLHIEAAHLCGISMGGMVGQLLAMDHPSRVRSLTSISSTTGDPQLPRPPAETMKTLTAPLPTTREAFLEWQVNIYRRTGSPTRPPDPAWLRERAARFWEHAPFQPAAFNSHLLAVVSAASRSERLSRTRAPALVIHGDADPVIPPAAAHATANAIAGARMLLVPGMGHDLAPAFLPTVTSELIRFINAARAT